MQNILEGIAIKWCYQINDIVTDSTERLFKIKANPTPDIEIHFWNKRYENLENVYTQLTDHKRKLIASILERSSSIYFKAFRKMFHRALAALVQARNVKCYMNALAQPLQSIQSANFHECKPLIRPLIHCICVMWSENCHYPSSNWRSFFKMLANMLIDESNRNLDADTLFQSDIDDSMTKIAETVIVIENFK